MSSFPASVRLPHAHHHAVPVPLFVAIWRSFVEAFAEDKTDWRTGALPRHHRRWTLADQLARGHWLSLDVLLRLLAPPGYRNTMHATNPFMTANALPSSPPRSARQPAERSKAHACRRRRSTSGTA